MKKTLIVIVALATSVAAQVPYFHLKHPTYKNYEEYNPYKSNEIEIKEWRFKKAELIEKELKRLNYPLTARVGPYREIDSNGHRVHTYFKREFKPRFGVVEVPGPLVPSDEFVDDGQYKTRKLVRKPIKVDQPLCIASGKYKGAVLTKLVVVYELVGLQWLCYDAYWVFVKPPVVASRNLGATYARQFYEASSRGATDIRISSIHGLPVGKPKTTSKKPRPDNRTHLEMLKDLERWKKKKMQTFAADSL